MAMTTQERMRFDRNTPWRPVPSGLNDTQDVDDALATGEPAFCCGRCLHPITDRAASLEMAGGHLHVFTNPGGFTYELALYAYADCIAYGEMTTEYTWFSGYAWQLALCANCQEHLGWRYLKAGSASFYGLIRDRLVEVNT
jgi:hypothetical protein